MQNSTVKTAARLLEAIRDAAGIRVFVETGTANGDVAYMAGDIFDTVITMESDTAAYEAAHERLSGRKGILPLTGDSRELLPQLLPRLVKPAVFWLAARPVDGRSPLAAELAALAPEPMQHIVIVPETAGPVPAEIARALAAPFPRDVAVHDGLVLAIPRTMAPLWDALFPDARPAFAAPA